MSNPDIMLEIQGLTSKRLQEQRTAHEKLVRIGEPAIPALLEVMEGNKKWESRERASRAVTQIIKRSGARSEAVLERLGKLAHNPDYFVASPAISCIVAYQGDARAAEILEHVARTSSNAQARTRVLGTLMVVTGNSPSLRPLLRHMLSDPDAEVRARAAGDLGTLGDISGLGVCRQILQMEPVDVRAELLVRAASIAAGRIGDPSLIPLLEKITKDTTGRYDRKAAYNALAEIRVKTLTSDAERIAFLAQCLGDMPNIRWAALKLKKMGTPEALGALQRIAKDADHPGKEEALRFLHGSLDE